MRAGFKASFCVLLGLGWACGASSAGDGPDAQVSADAAVEPNADTVFDPSVIRTFYLTVADADYQQLEADPRAEQYVPADLEVDGVTYPQVGLRYKGGYGTLYSCFDAAGNRLCPKLSMKIRFDEYMPDQRFYGLKRLNFHSMVSDDSKMRDFIGYALFRENDVYGPRASYAKLVVNGELLGLFALVEQVDGRFARMHFPDGGAGNVYKEVWPVHTTETPYLEAIKTNRDENPSAAGMVRFAQELAAATDATFVTVLEKWMDVEMLMRMLAVDRLIDNWDGIVAWYCVGGPCFNHNYYWYQSLSSDRVWLIPWDLDNTFQEPSPIRTYFNMPDWDESTSCTTIPIFSGIEGRPPGCDLLIRRLASVTWDRYVTATGALLAGGFQVATLHARIDALETHIEAAIAEDPNLTISVSQWRVAVQELKNSILAKRQYIEGKIAP